MLNRYGEEVTLYATDNNGIWDLYLNPHRHLDAIPRDVQHQECTFGNIDYVERILPRKLGRLAGYTRASDGKQL